MITIEQINQILEREKRPPMDGFLGDSSPETVSKLAADARQRRRDESLHVAVEALWFCTDDSTDPNEDVKVANEALQKMAEILEGRD